MKSTGPPRVHLPGLNGIRAMAATAVMVYHIDQFSRLFGLPELGFFRNGGAVYGVILFFVLSGYLITYLLVVEKHTFGRVSVGDFYVRRILRIWPLYYLTLFGTMTFLVVTGTPAPGGIGPTALLYGLLLSNVGYAFGYGALTLFPLWSIGVEEQFYALWPILIDRSRHAARALVAALCAYLAVKLCFRFSGHDTAYNLVGMTPYSCMAIGGLAAVAAREGSRLARAAFAPAVQIVAWLVLGYGLLRSPLHVFSFADQEINAVFYAIVIANVSLNPKTLVSLEHRVLDYVGKISYGIYMLHLPWLVLAAYFVHDRAGMVFGETWTGYGAVYATVIGGTLLLASASYRWFEQPFLRWKAAFSHIDTASSTTAAESPNLRNAQKTAAGRRLTRYVRHFRRGKDFSF